MGLKMELKMELNPEFLFVHLPWQMPAAAVWDPPRSRSGGSSDPFGDAVFPKVRNQEG
jgi:hypothetical protein